MTLQNGLHTSQLKSWNSFKVHWAWHKCESSLCITPSINRDSHNDEMIAVMCDICKETGKVSMELMKMRRAFSLWRCVTAFAAPMDIITSHPQIMILLVMSGSIPLIVLRGHMWILVQWIFGIRKLGTSFSPFLSISNTFFLIIHFCRIPDWRQRSDIRIVAPKIHDLAYNCPSASEEKVNRPWSDYQLRLQYDGLLKVWGVWQCLNFCLWKIYVHIFRVLKLKKM